MRTMTMKNERGIAMVATLLVMLLFSALMVGFTTVVMSDQRYRGIDRDRTQAFYAAHGGLEKMTADLNSLFLQNVAPTQAQLDTLMANPPNMAAEGIVFQDALGANGYTLRKPLPPNDVAAGMVSSGPYQGLIALKTRYELNSTARTRTGGEVHLLRNLETVAIPVFQFGMFSDVDLSYHAGPAFAFGGRIHSNANLFLASGDVANGLAISDKVTVVKDIIRDFLVNGQPVGGGTTWPGRVQQGRTPGACPAACRDLAINEGSLVDYLGSAANPIWPTLSLSTYNGYIRNGTTGAKPLNLPLVGMGAQNTALVGRPPQNSGEDVNNPALFGERYYSQVSLRILLSDTAADITNLPGVTANAPESLEATNWGTPATPWYNLGVADQAHPPLARSAGVLGVLTVTTAGVAGAATVRVNSVVPFQAPVAVPIAVATPVIFQSGGNWFRCTGFVAVPATLNGCTNTPALALNAQITMPYLSSQGTPLIGGFIKIERQDTNLVWTDVTREILGWGIAAANPSVAGCADPSPNAIVRLQRVADVPASPLAGGCTTAALPIATDFWPMALFDAREGLVRDVAPVPANPTLGGVMYYVQLDVRNLSRWFQGVAPYAAGSGPGSKWNNGFSVYFSDRRNNRNGVNETGEYGFEDVVNPQTAAGTPNGIFDQGEDLNTSGALDTYGQNPTYNGAAGVPPGAAAPLDVGARPWTVLTAIRAKANRPVLFRRALKLVNGGLGNIVLPGLTIVAENPVYVQGDWNAAPGFPALNESATSIVGDSLTLLSNNWNDVNSFANPYNPGARVRPAQSWYRFATIAGKNNWFPHPALEPTPDFGTDGGAHNFLHMLESGGTVNYRGSIATFFYSRQATGTYKCCNTVYGAPTRAFNFDVNFLTPALLPPLTPVFRDINTLGFSQETRPGI